MLKNIHCSENILITRIQIIKLQHLILNIGKKRILNLSNTRNNMNNDQDDDSKEVKLLDENYIFKCIDSTQQYFDDLLVKPVERRIDIKSRWD